MLFFMHLIWEANWKYVLTIPAMFMSIFLVLMLVPDVGLRLHHISEERARYMAVPLEHEGESHSAGEGEAEHPQSSPPEATPTQPAPTEAGQPATQ
jgi:cytochrome c oxidase subunit 4